MRLKSVPRPAFIAAAAVSLAACVLVVPGSAAATSAEAGPKPVPNTVCTTITANEHVLSRSQEDADPVGVPSVGDIGHFNNDFRKDDGTLVAETHGTVRLLYTRPSDGHIFGRYQETIRFAGGGVVTTLGVADISAMLQGGKSYISLTGVGGRYRGYFGIREWDFLTRDDTLATFTLCHV
ncbi:allene oxide cyclase barrel-like domain-containing protein [Streptomyces sp. WI04-05B]|uniref:allene oxide cyclase barrel-like domain-containing protein n=1 Tax=Streptomyces TaxID=1883 RepID=UPI0029AC6CF3|nr:MULTISPECIES: hypothetical protein [unclassified Streptomyces]MDX2548603.1 hypothetical protein [Streptomyces sp. WI04-05B]MDX2588091.1 hypothetical protein [Streptomyces sp. WI04-05A]MDX3751727.1 hypothetical protein [Streptomyces sp. AK08-02]